MGALNALFDSNILIDLLRRIPAAKQELDRYQSQNKSISLVTWIEVMAGATAANEAGTRELLDEFVILSVTEEIAERSAIIRRDQRIKLPDAIIWATAEIHGRILVTRNSKDFPLNHPAVRIPYVL